MQTTSSTEIHQLLSPRTIQVDLPGQGKEEVLNRMVDLLDGHPAVTGLDEVRDAVFEREEVMSTGVGKGLALPHAKTSAVTDTVAAFAITAEPVGFGSIDNEPVRLIFMLLGPETAKSQHIKLLSRISRLMNRDPFRERLLEARDAEEVLQIFEDGESQIMEA